MQLIECMFDQTKLGSADGSLMERDVGAERIDASPVWWSGLGPHVVLLWLLLVSFTWVVDVDRAVFDADEGAFLIQVTHLADEGTWWAPYPGAAVDPEQRFVGVNHALNRPGEVAPFPVRPVMVWISTMPWEVGGARAVTLFGITGVVVAAWAVARIAAMIEPDAAVVAFWLTGLASPLAFQALVLQGHGTVAGFAGLALVAVLSGRDVTSTQTVFACAGLAFTFSLAASLFRRETLVFAAALALAGGIALIRTRAIRPAALTAVPLFGAVAGIALDTWLMAITVDIGGRSLPGSRADASFLADRIESFGRFVLPGHPEPGNAWMFVLAAAFVCIVGAGMYVRNDDRRVLFGAATLAALLLAARLVLEPTPVIPGIIPVFPLGGAALILGTRGARREPLVPLLLTTFVAIVAVTGMTQHPYGGGFEWGSRYLSVGLVAALPLCGVGLLRTWRDLDADRTRVGLLGATLVIALTPTAMGLAAQRHARTTNAANLAAGQALASSIGTDVIISTHPEIPRVATDHLTSGVIWFLAPTEVLEGLLPLLEDAGHERAALFTRAGVRTIEVLEGTGWELRIVAIRPENPGGVALGILERTEAS